MQPAQPHRPALSRPTPLSQGHSLSLPHCRQDLVPCWDCAPALGLGSTLTSWGSWTRSLELGIREVRRGWAPDPEALLGPRRPGSPSTGPAAQTRALCSLGVSRVGCFGGRVGGTQLGTRQEGACCVEPAFGFRGAGLKLRSRSPGVSRGRPGPGRHSAQPSAAPGRTLPHFPHGRKIPSGQSQVLVSVSHSLSEWAGERQRDARPGKRWPGRWLCSGHLAPETGAEVTLATAPSPQPALWLPGQ